MSEPEVHPILIAVATTIADGLPVDWESLAAQHPELEQDLRGLRVLQEMEVARRGTAAEP
jgi:hypothetical protein